MQRLVRPHGKRIPRIKFLADGRQLPIAERQYSIIYCEHEKICIRDRFSFRSYAHFAAHDLSRLRRGAHETRLDFQFAVRSAHFNIAVRETFPGKFVLAAGLNEIDRNCRIRSVFLFYRQLDPASVAFY